MCVSRKRYLALIVVFVINWSVLKLVMSPDYKPQQQVMTYCAIVHNVCNGKVQQERIKRNWFCNSVNIAKLHCISITGIQIISRIRNKFNRLRNPTIQCVASLGDFEQTCILHHVHACMHVLGIPTYCIWNTTQTVQPS